MATRLSIYALFAAGLLLAGVVSAGPKIQHWTTQKGTRVYFVETKGLPLVDIQFVFDAGSVRDGDRFGLAAMTSSLLDKGAGQWNAGQIADRLEGVGAQLDTGVSRDSAWLTLRSLTQSEILDKALQTTAQVLSDPQFHERDFAREQKRILAGLRRLDESPAKVAKKAFFEAIYGEHPYAHRVLGEPATVAAYRVQDVRAFYREHYVASNAVAVVVGEVDRKTASAMIETLTAKLRAGSPPPAIPPVEYQSERARETTPFPSAQTHIYAGMPVVKRGDPQYFALYVGNHILGGGGLVSRISEEIREKRGLAYSSSSSFMPLMQKGPFYMGLQTRNDQAGEALKVLNQTLSDYIENGPGDEELEKARKNITGGFVLRIDSNSKVSDYVAMIGYYGLPLDYLDTFNAKVNAVTVDDIRQAFRGRLQLNRFQTILVGGESQSSAD